MNTSCSLLAGFILGTTVGVVYFVGLWLTVRRLAICANPKRLLRLSRMCRLLVALAVMVAAVRFAPVLFLTMMPGFVTGRFLICRHVIAHQSEACHASHA